VTNGAPLQVEELFQPKCLLQGGQFVTARAREMVSQQLKGSKFDTPEDIASFAQKFDEGLRIVFSDDNSAQYVKFGSVRDNDPKRGVKAGKLMLTGKQVAGFFEPSIQSTVDCIRESFTEVLGMNSYVFLVGEFGSSPWLADQLNRRLSDLGLRLLKPEMKSNKSVGAISFYIDHHVKRRVLRFTFGVLRDVAYEPSNPEHVAREHKSYLDVTGEKFLPDSFTTVLSKGTEVPESRVSKISMHAVREGAPPGDVLVKIMKYTEPGWLDTETNPFEILCYVAADISAVPCTSKIGTSGKMCFTRWFDVAFLVGPAELKVKIRWIDPVTGKEGSSDAALVYTEMLK